MAHQEWPGFHQGGCYGHVRARAFVRSSHILTPKSELKVLKVDEEFKIVHLISPDTIRRNIYVLFFDRLRRSEDSVFEIIFW